MEPFRGLQPYTEEFEEVFFGRDEERAILVDKLLSEKLTLLFAATGVGKSSLLQAAVIPELKRPARENLDTVYHNDWVTMPLEHLKQTIQNTLKEGGKIDFNFEFDENLSLKEFLHVAAGFASDPLVIMLDQFEEFFQYQRYSADLLAFVKQLAEAIRDEETSVVFLISMREDFALNLNAFRGYLPTTLFENYYRLEKLTVQKAKEAIHNPVEKVGFRFEEGLLDELLKDLADQEREGRIGKRSASIMDNAPAFVEAPNVQIVCKQLWEVERKNPNKLIRSQVYKDRGSAKGFVDSYFGSVIKEFSALEKRLSSKAFDHLVTPRGTKMAYPVKDLSDKLKVDEQELGNVLAKLEKARVLRSQDRQGVLWYELYHDIFSGIIYPWNEAYKNRQRIRHWLINAGIALFLLIMIIIGVDVYLNLTNYHFRLGTRGIADQVELFQGKARSLDFFSLQKYLAETTYSREELEPDKQFPQKSVEDYKSLNSELIGQLPITDRIEAYWNTGEIGQALKLADQSISEDNINRTKTIIKLLANFPSQQAFIVLKEHLDNSKNDSIRINIIDALGLTQFDGVDTYLTKFVTDQNREIRKSVLWSLSQIGSDIAIESLVTLLKDHDAGVSEQAAWCLKQVDSSYVMQLLLELLTDQKPEVKIKALEVLRHMSIQNIEPLINMLRDQDAQVRLKAVEALEALKRQESEKPLIALLNDPDESVRAATAKVLGNIGSDEAIEPLVALLTDQKEGVRNRAVKALTSLGNKKAIDPLIELLKKPNKYGRILAANLLGKLGANEAVLPLIGLLSDQERDVRLNAAAALRVIGNEEAMMPLIGLLSDQERDVRRNAAAALSRIGNEEAILPIVELYPESGSTYYESNYAAVVLKRIGCQKVAIQPLLNLLTSQNSVLYS